MDLRKEEDKNKVEIGERDDIGEASNYMCWIQCFLIDTTILASMVIIISTLLYWYNDYEPNRQCCLWQTQITGTHQ